MAELRIERLTIRWPGATEAEARILARLVTEELARIVANGGVFLPGTALPAHAALAPGHSLEALAAQIAADILTQAAEKAAA